jgi:hypothetical protein
MAISARAMDTARVFHHHHHQGITIIIIGVGLWAVLDRGTDTYLRLTISKVWPLGKKQLCQDAASNY